MTITLDKYKSELTKSLTSCAGSEAAQQARLLLCYGLGISPEQLIFLNNRELSDTELDLLEGLRARRIAGEPVQYILGEWDIMGLSFICDSRALIPRQDTETLIEYAISAIHKHGYKTALDMCCGTGCIGISLARFTNIAVTLSDISKDCIDLTNANLEKHGINAKTIISDMFEQIHGTYDIMTINPPYLDTYDMEMLQTEVRAEPTSALFGGSDGLGFYRTIATHYKKHINIGGMLLLEIGERQGEAVRLMFDSATVISDINGKDRVVCVEC